MKYQPAGRENHQPALALFGSKHWIFTGELSMASILLLITLVDHCGLYRHNILVLISWKVNKNADGYEPYIFKVREKIFRSDHMGCDLRKLMCQDISDVHFAYCLIEVEAWKTGMPRIADLNIVDHHLAWWFKCSASASIDGIDDVSGLVQAHGTYGMHKANIFTPDPGFKIMQHNARPTLSLSRAS